MRTHFSPWACLALCLPFPLSAQTGPGGIGSSTNNVLWLSADKGTTVSGGQVTNWTDRSGNSNTAAPSAASARPALVSGALNGQPVLRFDGSTDELRISDNSSIDLTAWHFFLVLRANLQKNYNAWLTKGDDSAENYEMLSYDDGNIHAPVLWTDNTRTSPSSPAGQVTTSGASIIEYSYKSSNGRSICTNGASVFTDTENRTPKVNARELYIGNERGTTGRFMDGDLAEVIAYKDRLNAVQRVIVNNYLAAKYGLALASDDLYTQDNPANGNFDFDMAGIGKVNSTNKQLDSKGSGQVRITSAEPAAFENNEYLLWGHNNGWFGTGSSSDYPSSIQGRWGRVWRVNEVTAAGVAADIGAVDITFDLTGMGSVTASQLRLLVDTDNDGVFADETPINGATSVGGGSYRFANRTELANGVRFTLGTTNVISTPLPIELLSFGVSPQGHEAMEVRWSTASEQDNALFT
ncbi:MAG: hypothetical protein JST66_02155, partial [Bacteroidetes bacterium]|nr:hypothetical protein [Bacteroidota bacterium]